MTSNVSVLDRAAGMDDPGRVAEVGWQRPDPEVTERARRRSFTAQYKLRVLGAYEAAVKVTVASARMALPSTAPVSESTPVGTSTASM